MSSVAEAELGALYINSHKAVPQRTLLKEMGHQQPEIPMQTDNTTVLGVVNNNIQPWRTKAMDMCFCWLQDREAQKQFRFYWRPGTSNFVDYWTKHHSAAHHKTMRSEFLTPKSIVSNLRNSLKRNPFKSSERVC